MVKPGGKRTYQCARIESSKVCHNDIYKNVSRCKSSSQTNGQHGGTFLHQADGGGTHKKVLSGLTKKIWNYLIVNGITITVKYLHGILNMEADF